MACLGLIDWVIEKWDDRKWEGNGKVGRQKRFQFFFYVFGWSWKSGENGIRGWKR